MYEIPTFFKKNLEILGQEGTYKDKNQMEVEKGKGLKKAVAFRSCCRDQMGYSEVGAKEQSRDGFYHEQVAVMRECLSS